MRTRWLRGGLIIVVLLTAGGAWRDARAQSTAFTYQGLLKRAGMPVAGTCDFEFSLFDAAVAGTQIGTTQDVSGVSITNGLFTVQLDFGANAFLVSNVDLLGGDRWLEIGVRCGGGSGDFARLSPRQPLTPTPYALFAPLAATDQSGSVRALMNVFDDGTGYLRTRGAKGNTTVLINTPVDSPDNGFVGVYNPDGNERASMCVLDSGEGFIRTLGPNGNSNVLVTSLTDNPNNGFVGVYDANGDAKAGLFVDASGRGEIFADTKNFAVDDPTRPGSKIIYTSLEGPEAAIYHRGVVKLRNGRGTIDLPDHFVALANADSITVQLTPASFDSEGLAVGAIHDGHIEIGELHKGHGSYDVYFVVHAVRRGYEQQRPVVSNEEYRAHFGHLLSAGARGAVHALDASGFTVRAQSVRRAVE